MQQHQRACLMERWADVRLNHPPVCDAPHFLAVRLTDRRSSILITEIMRCLKLHRLGGTYLGTQAQHVQLRAVLFTSGMAGHMLSHIILNLNPRVVSQCCQQLTWCVTSVSVSLILPETAPVGSLQAAVILSSSRLKTRSMPTLTPTAGTSLLLNMPTSLSYLHTKVSSLTHPTAYTPQLTPHTVSPTTVSPHTVLPHTVHSYLMPYISDQAAEHACASLCSHAPTCTPYLEHHP